MNKSKDLKKAFNELVGKMNMNPQRWNIIYEWSNGRTRDLNEFTESELINVVQHLRKLWEAKPQSEKAQLEQMQTMRKKFYSFCHLLNWTKNDRLDYKRINNWLKNKSTYKKPIDDHNFNELVYLVTQITMVYKSQGNAKV